MHINPPNTELLHKTREMIKLLNVQLLAHATPAPGRASSQQDNMQTRNHAAMTA